MKLLSSVVVTAVYVHALTFLMCATTGNAFQFMKDWKMPTYDPNEEAVKEKFGDKSKSIYIHVVVCVCVVTVYEFKWLYLPTHAHCMHPYNVQNW